MPQEAPHCFGDGKLIFLQFMAHWVCEGAVCAHLAPGLGFPRGKWRELLVCNPWIRKLILEQDILLLKTKNSSGHSTHSSSKPELLKHEYVIQDSHFRRVKFLFLFTVPPPLHPPNNSLVPGIVHSGACTKPTQQQHPVLVCNCTLECYFWSKVLQPCQGKLLMTQNHQPSQ